ncbi:MAG: alanine--glyoxylate aminotransferase family protein [Candidatus Hadarchaeum sp.]|uniref:pyridoxal-phosphate-dependent aminotransferase family protein n=1 Tax=Candidatus Hadarchaeum sp. TaxID=2883567 RepID=UPI003170B6ED
MKLFTVGPVACRPEVLAEMGRQMFSHRSEEYRELHRQTVERLQKFLETKNQVFLFPSSGSGVMEGTVRNCVDKKMLCCINGEFGKRYAEVGVSNGREVERLETELGSATTPEQLEEKLSQCPDVEAVTITYNETSTGVINPLPELAKVVKEQGKLLFVDAVSAMGGVEIKVDEWGIDVCFASSQKCFGVPPGLAVGSVSEEALEKSEKAKNKGWYFDFKLYEEYQEDWGTHMTPPVPQIAALNKELEIIEKEGGKAKRLELYQRRSRMIKEGVEALGLSLFPKTDCQSPTVSCVRAPKSMSGLEVYKRMRQKGFELAKGYGSLKDSTFRIGNMGYIPMEDIEEMLQALSEVIKQQF